MYFLYDECSYIMLHAPRELRSILMLWVWSIQNKWIALQLSQASRQVSALKTDRYIYIWRTKSFALVVVHIAMFRHRQASNPVCYLVVLDILICWILVEQLRWQSIPERPEFYKDEDDWILGLEFSDFFPVNYWFAFFNSC